jgi:hypothetical protein
MHQIAVTGAQDAFTGTKMPQWPRESPSFWWLSDFDFGGTIPATNAIVRCSAVLFLPTQDGLGTVSFVAPTAVNPNMQIGMTVDRVGQVVSTHATCGWLAMKAFMETELAQLEKIHPDRGTRRRALRENEQLPEFHIIQLRRRSPSEQGEQRDREYHHRWIVKGHWRRLHEPRKADGVEVTFVNAYVKGPEDAPLLQPRESVYVVAR